MGLLGKGEVTYSSDELKKMIEKRNIEKNEKLIMPSIEVIHRNHWVQI